MAGKYAKQGIKSFPINSDFFNDTKIQAIENGFGNRSSYVLIRILCDIYENKGYYIKWDDELCNSIANRSKVRPGFVKEVVIMALSVGFFNKELFKEHNVLSSEEIQNTYESMARRRINAAIIDEYRLNVYSKLISAYKNDSIYVSRNKNDKNSIQRQGINYNLYIKETLSKERVKKGKPFPSHEEAAFRNNSVVNSSDELQTKPVNDLPKVLPSDFSNVFEKSLSECYEELSSNTSWLEAILMSKHSAGFKNLDEDSLKAYLKKFFNRLTLQGITSKSPKDAMSHFVNWLDLELPKAKTDIHKEENEALMESVKEENAKYYKFLAYIQNQAPICFANMKLPSVSESIFIREKYGSEMFKKALRTIEGRPDIRSKWDVLYFALLKQFDFIRLNS